MAYLKNRHHHPLLFLAMFCAALALQEARASPVQIAPAAYQTKDDPKRMLIGSVAPTCTYNECKGCKYKCKAEQVPVEGNDPINSAYHYKCVCRR